MYQCTDSIYSTNQPYTSDWEKMVSTLSSIHSKAILLSKSYTMEYLGTGAFTQDNQPSDYIWLQQHVAKITNGSYPTAFFLYRYIWSHNSKMIYYNHPTYIYWHICSIKLWSCLDTPFWNTFILIFDIQQNVFQSEYSPSVTKWRWSTCSPF